MRVVPYQEILEEKFLRQKELLALGAERHANGHCFHIGDISYGCRACYTGEQAIHLFHGTQCMCKCPYCYYNPSREEQLLSEQQQQKELEFHLYKLREFENYRPAILSMCSSGETLLYIDVFEKYAAQIYPLIYRKNIHPYTYLYTNGILADEPMLRRVQAMGVNELRFHWSASNFSDQVYEHMKLAKEMGFLVTVEEPAYPPNKEAIIEHLPMLEEVGISHLDMIELHMTAHNWDALERIFPGKSARVYKDYFYHLYDEGMTYDIMEHALRENYHFSVLDCNSGVERCRNNQDQDVCFSWDSVEGMCRPWDSGRGFRARMRNGCSYRDDV